MKYRQGQRPIEQKMSVVCALACACGIKSDECNTFPVTGVDDFQYPSVIEPPDLASRGLLGIYSMSPNTIAVESQVLQHIPLNVSKSSSTFSQTIFSFTSTD